MNSPHPDDTAAWAGALEELSARRAFAQGLGGAQAVEKHHRQGRLTVRERIQGLVDAGSFKEVGTLTGQGHYEAINSSQ